MKILIHPLIIPFYAFCLMCEIERQSYALEPWKTLYMLLFVLAVSVVFPYLTRFQFSDKKPDALWDTSAGLKSRLQYAFILTATYMVFSYMIEETDFFNAASKIPLFSVFIIPLWLNVLSGGGFLKIFPKRGNFFFAKINLAQPTFSGSLSVFVLMTGYKEGIDTFWPFVISLLIFSAASSYRITRENEQFSHHLYGFSFGAVQTAVLFLV